MRKVMLGQRITTSKRFAALMGGLGYTKRRSGLRPLQRFVSPQFASPSLASQALIRAGKPSFTLNVMRNTTLRDLEYIDII